MKYTMECFYKDFDDCDWTETLIKGLWINIQNKIEYPFKGFEIDSFIKGNILLLANKSADEDKKADNTESFFNFYMQNPDVVRVHVTPNCFIVEDKYGYCNLVHRKISAETEKPEPKPKRKYTIEDIEPWEIKKDLFKDHKLHMALEIVSMLECYDDVLHGESLRKCLLEILNHESE